MPSSAVKHSWLRGWSTRFSSQAMRGAGVTAPRLMNSCTAAYRGRNHGDFGGGGGSRANARWSRSASKHTPSRAPQDACQLGAQGLSLFATVATSLRTYVFLDSLQPQFAAHICTTCRGYFPVPYVASLFVEIAPGMAIHGVIDVALKKTRVHPATLVVERAYGMLEVHSQDKGEVRSAGDEILKVLGCTENDRIKPKLVSNTIIRAI